MTGFDRIAFVAAVVLAIVLVAVLSINECWIPNGGCRKIAYNVTITTDLLTPQDIKSAGLSSFYISEVSGFNDSPEITQTWRNLGWQKTEYVVYVNKDNQTVIDYAYYFLNSSGAKALYDHFYSENKSYPMISSFPKFGDNSFAAEGHDDGYDFYSSIFYKGNIVFQIEIRRFGESDGLSLLNKLSSIEVNKEAVLVAGGQPAGN